MGVPSQVKNGVYVLTKREMTAMDITYASILNANDTTSGIEVTNTEYGVRAALVVDAASAFLKISEVYFPGLRMSKVCCSPFAYTSLFLDSGGIRMMIAARIKDIISEHNTALPYIYSVPVMETSKAKKPKEQTLKFVAIQQASF